MHWDEHWDYWLFEEGGRTKLPAWSPVGHFREMLQLSRILFGSIVLSGQAAPVSSMGILQLILSGPREAGGVFMKMLMIAGR